MNRYYRHPPRFGIDGKSEDGKSEIHELDEYTKLLITTAIDPHQNKLMLDVRYHDLPWPLVALNDLKSVMVRLSDVIDQIDRSCSYNGTRPEKSDLAFILEEPDVERTLILLVQNFYKIYFSFPFCHLRERGWQEQGIRWQANQQLEPAKVQLYSINPLFVPFSDEFLIHEFQSLNDFLSDSFQLIDFGTDRFKQLVEVAKSMLDAIHQYINYADSHGAFESVIVEPITKLLEIAGCLAKIAETLLPAGDIQKERPDDNFPLHYLISDENPDFLFDSHDRKSIMFCETNLQFRDYFLKHDNSQLNNRFTDFLLQYCYDLISTKNDISFISDIGSLIMLGLNYTDIDREHEMAYRSVPNDGSQMDVQHQLFRDKAQQPRQRKSKTTFRNISFKYQIIDCSTVGLTVQSAFASILYRQSNLKRDQIKQQSINCSILCRMLSRLGVPLLKSYQDSLLRFSNVINSQKFPQFHIANDVDLTIQSLNELEIIHKNEEFSSYAQVLKFKNHKYNSSFIYDSKNIDQTIAIKLYDTVSLAKLDDSYLGCQMDEMFILKIADSWIREVNNYQILTKYRKKNPNKPLDVPEFFSHGKLQLKVGDSYICGGLFIAMSYIEPMDYPINSPEIDDLVVERYKSSNKILAKLQVKHNADDNELIYHNKKLYLINFSHELYHPTIIDDEVLDSLLIDLKRATITKLKFQETNRWQFVDGNGRLCENHEQEGLVDEELRVGKSSKTLSTGSQDIYHGSITRKRCFSVI